MWSYLLMAVGVTGLYLAGKKSLWGWAIGFFAQFLWVIYALVTSQYGFIVSAVVYGFVYAKNYFQWRSTQNFNLEFDVPNENVDEVVKGIRYIADRYGSEPKNIR